MYTHPGDLHINTHTNNLKKLGTLNFKNMHKCVHVYYVSLMSNIKIFIHVQLISLISKYLYMYVMASQNIKISNNSVHVHYGITNVKI